jgi:hypothetical protein
MITKRILWAIAAAALLSLQAGALSAQSADPDTVDKRHSGRWGQGVSRAPFAIEMSLIT